MEETACLLKAAIIQDDLFNIANLINQGHQPTTEDFVLAIERKSYSVLELFLQRGYEINKPLRLDYPPALACAFSDKDMSEWLLDHGADPNARCFFDMTPLTIAAQSASRDIIELLFDHGASVEHGAPLHMAARHQRPDEIIKFFIEKGANINELLFQNDTTSWNHYVEALPLGTPLHEAANNKDERVIKLLLQHGANPNIKDNFGQLPEIKGTSRL